MTSNFDRSAEATLHLAEESPRPRVGFLGVGWIGRPLPVRVTYVPDLASAVGLVTRAVGG